MILRDAYFWLVLDPQYAIYESIACLIFARFLICTFY